MNSDTPCTPGSPGETFYTRSSGCYAPQLSPFRDKNKVSFLFHLSRHQLSSPFAQEGIFFGSLRDNTGPIFYSKKISHFLLQFILNTAIFKVLLPANDSAY